MNQEELERLIEIASQTSQGLGEETITEEILDETVGKSGKLGEKRTGSIERNDVIHDYRKFYRRFYDCGCLAKNLKPGTRCYKGHVPCANHGYRCIRCRRAVCISCLRSMNGTVYCRWCFVLRRITRFLHIRSM